MSSPCALVVQSTLAWLCLSNLLYLLHILFNFQECLLGYSVKTNILIVQCLLAFKKCFISDECVRLRDQNIDVFSMEVCLLKVLLDLLVPVLSGPVVVPK